MKPVLWILVFIAAVASLHVARMRVQSEETNRRVQIVVDYTDLRGISELTGTPIDEVMKRYKGSGAHGIAFAESSFEDLRSTGDITLVPMDIVAQIPKFGQTRLKVSNWLVWDRLINAIQSKTGLDVKKHQDGTIQVNMSWGELSGLPVGFFNGWGVQWARQAGLEPVLRPTPFAAGEMKAITATLDEIRKLGGHLVIVNGDQVLGYPGFTKDVAREMGARGLVFGQVEFGKQKGDIALGSILKGRFVRVHSISPTEMLRMSKDEAVERFARAAEERNIRALYVRILPGAYPDPVQANADYVRSIAEALDDRGIVLGQARPFSEYHVPVWERCVIGAGVAAGTVLLALSLWPLGLGCWILLAFIVLCDIFGPAVGIGRKLAALQGSIVFPVLGYALWRDLRWTELEGKSVSHTNRGSGMFRDMALIIGCTLLGALSVVGLLSSAEATVKVVEFSGIKAQQVGTILLIAAMLVFGVSSRGGRSAAIARVKTRAMSIWNEPLKIGWSILAVLALVALAMLIARSGNDAGIGVSPMELKFRALLDQLLGTRPRTKEFLVGHPALFLGLGLLSLRRIRWAVPLLIVGAIGQVSIINTFCHLHSPLLVSAVRMLNGIWTGALVAGLIGIAVNLASRRSPRRKKA